MVRSISELTPDQRVDLAGTRLLVQVDAVVRERVLAPAARLLLALLLVTPFRVLGGALYRALLRAAGRLGDAVADEVHRVQPRHVLELQEIDSMALALAEQRDQHVRPRHLVAAGGLDVDRGALHDALEPRGGLRVARAVGRQAGEILVEELAEVGAQLVEIDPAGAQHRRGVVVVGEPEQEMLEGRVFVAAFAREREGAMQRLFEITREHGRRS